MREAMAGARLGDDTFGEDPTVRELEELVADRLKTEAAMLVLSGTMANLVAVMSHCRRSEVVYLDSRAHVLLNEAGGLTGVAGVTPTIVSSHRGHMDPVALTRAIGEPRVQQPVPRLVWIENTHNRAGGTVLNIEGTKALVEVSQAYGLRTHVDGARLFNAGVALGVEPSELTSGVDSIYVDLTKGLCCPLGALVAGSYKFVAQARRNRQMVGGGMRQAGVIAACGLVALSSLVERLEDDHRRAMQLARRLAAIDGFTVNLSLVDTNIVFADVKSLGGAESIAQRLEAYGVLVSRAVPDLLRFVTHMGIDDDDIEWTWQMCARIAEAVL
jgi:threonine aldolase